jgi:tetratricopeptide (TPR) repeat protein
MQMKGCHSAAHTSFPGMVGRLGLAVCLILGTVCNSKGAETRRAWTDWQQEGNELLSSGNFTAAVQAYRRALATGQGTQISVDQMVSLHESLAWAYSEEGQFAESECEYRQALGLVQKDKGIHSLDYALLLASLSLLPTQTGDRNGAIETLREALSINEGSSRKADLAIVRDGLAKILCKEKRYEEAETSLEQSEVYYSRNATTQPQLVAELLNDLAVLRWNQGRYTEAAGLHKQSLHQLVLETVCGNEHPTLVVPLNNLATIHLQLGRFDEAERNFQRAVAICRKTLGEDHPTYAEVLSNYAALLRKVGRKREAKKMAEQAQNIVQASNRHNGIGMRVDVSALNSDGG